MKSQEAAARFNRPGVSDEFLVRAACHHIGSDECVQRYSYRAEGIAIPFRDLDSQPIVDNAKLFARVRHYTGTDSQKYHQRAGSGTHIYIPPNFRERPRGATLILTEGEFKALSLAEAGFSAVGLCGISGAMRNTGGEVKLHDELVQVLEFHKPSRVLFLGDSDAVLNSDFSREASKLRKVLFDSKRFSFVQELRVAVCPLCDSKGVDDVRGAMGVEFNAWFEALAESAFVVPSKATPAEVFCALLRRESERVRTAISGDEHDAHRNRVRLLQSAGKLQRETGAMLLLKPLFSDLLNVKESALAGMIRDASGRERDGDGQQDHAKDKLQGSAVELADIELWPGPVNGADVLDEAAESFGRYIALPDGAADALALWCAHAHAFKAFLCSPRLNISSPEKGCGKTTLRDVVAVLVPRPLLTENLSVAVLFRLVEAHAPTILADEYDAWLRDNEELRGLLNAGHRRGGVVYRCEGDSHEVRGFQVFAPAVLCGIGALPGTLHDRSIVIRLERAKPGELRERFDSRRVECETELCRKLARWCADHSARLENNDPGLPSGVFNRLADNWRPLFAVAEIAGGDWPARAAAAFAMLTNRTDADAQGMGVMLLADVQEAFHEMQAERMFSKALVESLCAMSDRPWPEAHRGKPISETWLARRLHSFGVAPRTLRIGNDRAKGYEAADFAEAFARYLPAERVLKRDGVTTQTGVEYNDFSKRDTEENCHGSKTSETPETIGLSRCHDSNPPAEETQLAEAMLL